MRSEFLQISEAIFSRSGACFTRCFFFFQAEDGIRDGRVTGVQTCVFRSLAPILEVNSDTMPATLQYDVADPRQPSRILGELGRGRFTVRLVARATERAREFPTGQRTAVLDDSVFALYVFAAWRGASEPGTLTAIFPRGLRRDVVQIHDLGMTSTTLNRDPARLRHIVVGTEGQGTVNLWLDEAGRLMKVDIPSRHLVVERLAGS